MSSIGQYFILIILKVDDQINYYVSMYVNLASFKHVFTPLLFSKTHMNYVESNKQIGFWKKKLWINFDNETKIILFVKYWTT